MTTLHEKIQAVIKCLDKTAGEVTSESMAFGLAVSAMAPACSTQTILGAATKLHEALGQAKGLQAAADVLREVLETEEVSA